MSDEAIERGWGWPGLSRKAHYFIDGRSLCRRRWIFTGALSQDSGGAPGPDDCVVCHRKSRAAKEARRG